MTSKSLLRTILAWFVAAIFIFPIYFWVTVSIKKDKDIFAIPPKLISFEPSFKAYEEVLGISSFLYVVNIKVFFNQMLLSEVWGKTR